MSVQYQVNVRPTLSEFVALLEHSGLSERRPVDNTECLEGMLANANLIVTARLEGTLVGIARAITDFHYACYLSDLAVDRAHQRQGIGKALQSIILRQLKPTCKLILLAAPAANSYYPSLGFENNPRCWVYSGTQQLSQPGHQQQDRADI